MIQIFGTKKCKDSKKAERFFKERRVKFQLVDLNNKGLSKGELKKIANAVGIENMVNTDSKDYINKGFKYMNTPLEELLLENPTILTTPIVRNLNKATLGYEPDVWKTWLD